MSGGCRNRFDALFRRGVNLRAGKAQQPLADGARRFTTPVPGDAGIGELVAVGDTLAVQTGELVVLLSAADGTARATIGTRR